jgi:hypothetical protein
MVSNIVQPGTGMVFMKIGTHAGETLSDIIERKRKEIEDAGHALWGYGGNTCHPLTMVQPFARDFEQRNGVIYLCMQPMTSRHFAPAKRAEFLSKDGVEWEEVPPSINVRGSRYALAVDEIQDQQFDLPLASTRVAIGSSMGRRGDRYVRGRVDKACLEVTEEPEADDVEVEPVHIGFTARLTEPYAVLLR